MIPFNLETVLAKIDELGQEDMTDIDPKMVKTKSETLAEIKAFVSRYATVFKSMPLVAPMTEGRMQLEFCQGDRELEVEFGGIGEIAYLMYNKTLDEMHENRISVHDQNSIAWLLVCLNYEHEVEGGNNERVFIMIPRKSCASENGNR